MVREHTTTIIAFGDCAVTSNVPGHAQPHRRRAAARPRLPRERDHQRAGTRRRWCRRCCPCPCRCTRSSTSMSSCRAARPRRTSSTRCSMTCSPVASPRRPGHGSVDKGAPPMSRTITIDPVTRIEGHSKITIQLDEQGEVTDAHFHVTQFRGFETDRPGPSGPRDARRSWPASAASARSATWWPRPRPSTTSWPSIRRPPAPTCAASSTSARSCSRTRCRSSTSPRRTCSSASMPILPSATSSAVAQENPQLAMDGIRLRKWGQQIIELLGGKRIHPGGIIPGGVAEPADRGGPRPDPGRRARGHRPVSSVPSPGTRPT